MSGFSYGCWGNEVSGTTGFEPGSPADATSLVELSICGRNLRDMDVYSKSDPMCVVYVQPFGTTNSWIQIMRTECIQNTLNPQFTRKAKISNGQQKHLKFEMYDIDNISNNLNEHDFMGRATCTLGQIVTAGGSGITLKLNKPNYNGNCGEIIISAEELAVCKDKLELEFMANKLDKKDWFGTSDPFLQISRSNERPGQFTLVHRTEYLYKTLNPTWKRFVIPIRSLCNGNLDRNMKFECLDYNQNGNHSYIGEFSTTVRQLLVGPGPPNIYSCINVKKKDSKKGYRNSGKIHLLHSKLQTTYSFLDYVRGGTELACTISIDFTGSNGEPDNPNSRHYLNPNGKLI